MFRIGCHLSIAEGYFKALQNILSIGGNTYQYFSRNPQGGKAKAFNQKDFDNFIAYAKNNQVEGLLCHAPYTLNPASEKENVREFALICFKEDLEILERFPNGLYNFHPGSCGKQDRALGLKMIIDTLNLVMFKDMNTTILLETMSGKGSELGITFEEIKTIIDGLIYKEHIGVTIDTCHIYSAGYDIVNDLDGVIDTFDRVIGLKYLKAIHLNDSMTSFNSRKDRHQKIGKGSIGLDTIIRIMNHPKLKDLPFYLETPNDLEGFKNEIQFLKSKREEL